VEKEKGREDGKKVRCREGKKANAMIYKSMIFQKSPGGKAKLADEKTSNRPKKKKKDPERKNPNPMQRSFKWIQK